jgi:hypothetical protein
MSFGSAAPSVPNMRRLFLSVILCAVGWTVGSTVALASPAAISKPNARTDRLSGLSSAELTDLEPHLQRGPVALIEFADVETDALPGIHIAVRVHAKAARLLEVVRNPEGYPRFLPTLDEVEIIGKAPKSIIYDWRWEMAVLEFQGRNTMTVLEPSAERAAVEGYRVTIDSHSGDLGAGRISMRIIPVGKDTCTLLISMRMDLREANYVARQLAVAARSVNRSANIALTYAMLLGFKQEAERRDGYVAAERLPRGLTAPELDARAIYPLLRRGDVVLLDLAGAYIERVAVIGFVYQPRQLVLDTMLDAKSFGASLMPGASARVVGKENGMTTFAWEIDLPLVGVEGQMQMHTRQDEVISIRATEGAMSGGQWLFDTKALGSHATLVSAWGRFDLADSAWLVRKLAAVDHNLGHGLTVASEVMLVRALRSRSGKRAEELAAAALKLKQAKPD